jgi:phosphoribosyl 1,2-cyclic phosphate phosphodiesterase
LVEVDGKSLLIDCGPDFRWQMIRNGISHLDAILLTHEHYDHVGGLDDVRPMCREHGMEIYAERNVIEAIRTRLPYVFREHRYPGVPNLLMREIDLSPFEVAGVRVIPIRVMHAKFPKLEGVRVLVLDALRELPHLSHESLGEALALAERIAPEETYFVHMSHRIGLHAEIEHRLPPHAHYAYDGLRLEF